MPKLMLTWQVLYVENIDINLLTLALEFIAFFLWILVPFLPNGAKGTRNPHRSRSGRGTLNLFTATR